MASCTLSHRLFSGGLFIRKWVVSEGEEAPAVGLGKSLTVFYGQVDAVVLAVEIAAPGWFLARAVWKSRIKNPRQLLYDYRSFRKLARLQICIDVFLLDVDVMIFGKSRFPVV